MANEITKELPPLDLEGFKAEIREQMIRDMQSGILEKDRLKTRAKNLLQQKVNERILGKVIPEERSLGGFIENAKEDVQELVTGIGALLGLGWKALGSPIESAKKGFNITKNLITSPAYRDKVKVQFVNPIVDEYKEYRNPLTKLYEDPADVLLDVMIVASGGALLTAKGGALAGKIGATTLGKGLTQTAKALNVAATPLKLQRIGNATKFTISKLPGGKAIVENFELATQTRKILRREQASFLSARNRVIQEIDKRIKRLTPQEVEALPLAAQGFARPPVGASTNFYEALGLVRSLAKNQERFGIKIGKLTPEIIERRKFQPLEKFLVKEGKLTYKTPYEELTGNALIARINKIKEFFPEADPIYMRHFFDDEPAKFARFFLNTQPVRTFKPGFLKKSYGVEGYIGAPGKAVTKAQLKEVLVKQGVENVKWQRNIALIERLRAHPMVKPLKVGQEPLPGYKIFAPDGMLRFYSRTMDLTSELNKKIAGKGDVWEVFEDAVKTAFPKEKIVGVTNKVRLYQAPEAMANELSKMVAASNPYVKLFWDAPLDAFRFAVLSLMPRWNMNNAMGNMIFSIVDGTAFNPKAFYIYRQIKKMEQKKGKQIFPDELFGGVHQVERTTAGNIGGAVDRIPWVRSTVAMHEQMLDTRVIGAVMKVVEGTVKVGVYKPISKLGNLGFRLNFAVDDIFKGVGFIKRALLEERKGFLRRMVASFDDSLKAIEKLKKQPAKLESVIDDVHNWYYHGLNITEFERRAVRRVIPFYTWMRWVTLYATRIATEAPVRANIIKNISRDFYMFTGQNKLPPGMEGAIAIGNDEDGGVYYLRTTGMNPFDTLNDFMSEGLFTAIKRGLAPGVKTALEQATGAESFLGIPFTRKDIHSSITGQLFKFDPELGKVEEVRGTVKPALIETLLRNYIPQYLMMEVMLTGGKKRYTAEGMDTILMDLFKDPKERQAIVQDIITLEGEQRTTPILEVAKGLGISIKLVEPENERQRLDALQKATTAILNKELPILNPNFKNLLKDRVMTEMAKGIKGEELKEKIKVWIGQNVEQLKKLK